VGFWTPEYLDEKLAKIRQADVGNLLLAVSEELDCTKEDIDLGAERLLWFKTGIHVYDVVDVAEECAVQAPPAGP
jgi:predicted nuclease of restriction endonuclease-like RecB superfamily